MQQQTSNCKLGQKLEGAIKPFGSTMYDSEFGELGNHVFSKKFYKLGEMVVQRAMADVVQCKEGDEIRQLTHEWMGQPENKVGSLAYWLRPTPSEDALAVLDDDERRVLSAILDPKFATNEYCSRERFRAEETKLLRKLRVLN